jgi:signal transduction histidine kinase
LIVTIVNAVYSWYVEQEPDTFTFTMLSSAVWLLAPVAVGLAVRGRREADERARELERERLGAQERLRMAREVHDAVGHSLAVISVNAGAALHVLAKLPTATAEVTESLRAIRQASRAGLDELRSTLAAGRPTGLAALPGLVEATNVDGLRTLLRTEGAPRELKSTVDGAAYRIVQEALTNVVRHARATTATVTVDYGPQRLTLTIADDGAGSPIGPSGGLGLENMRRRAHHEGGTLEARPGVKGFVVQAVLPYEGHA